MPEVVIMGFAWNRTTRTHSDPVRHTENTVEAAERWMDSMSLRYEGMKIIDGHTHTHHSNLLSDLLLQFGQLPETSTDQDAVLETEQ